MASTENKTELERNATIMDFIYFFPYLESGRGLCHGCSTFLTATNSRSSAARRFRVPVQGAAPASSSRRQSSPVNIKAVVFPPIRSATRLVEKGIQSPSPYRLLAFLIPPKSRKEDKGYRFLRRRGLCGSWWRKRGARRGRGSCGILRGGGLPARRGRGR